MPFSKTHLIQTAEINLRYALAEVEGIRDRESIQRAIGHAALAEAYLNVLLAECESEEEEEVA